MDILEDENFQEFLKTKNCRGCVNRCVLTDPICNRSKIFIQEAYEEYLDNSKK